MVMTKNDVKKVLGNVSVTHLLKAKPLYGRGLRLMECVRMRIQDVDFERNLICVRPQKETRKTKSPLRREKDKMFKPKFAITPKINKALVEIERVRGFLDAVKLKDEWIADMQKNALILEAHHSTHIEGTALTLEQAKSILEGYT